MHTGRCDCGKVAFEFDEMRPTVTACHCSQCRRASGHYWASTHVPHSAFQYTNDEGLTWYKSSDWAKRGFCKFCGCSLFWQMKDEAHISVAAGCVDDPTGLTLTTHIFVKDKSDYYDIADDAEQIMKY